MAESIRIFIIDDNRLLREGLVSMLTAQQDISVVGAAAMGDPAIDQIENLNPDIALIDIGMPAKDGIEITQALRLRVPKVKVIILGMPDLTDEIMTCIEAGAAGYILKDASFENLVTAIRLTNRGESICTSRIAASLFSRVAELAEERVQKNTTKLTPREIEIIHQIAGGLSNKEIAIELTIELQTVKNHIHNVLDKLQLNNRLEAVQYARDRNLLYKNILSTRRSQ